MSNILDQDLDQHFVSPDLGLNCLQMLYADYNMRLSKERVKQLDNK